MVYITENYYFKAEETHRNMYMIVGYGDNIRMWDCRMGPKVNIAPG